MNIEMIKAKVAAYEKRPWNHADKYNELVRDIQRVVPGFMRVPRENIWMHNDLPAGELSPLINDLVLGQEYIDICLTLGIDWTEHQRWCPKYLRGLTIGPNRSLQDAWVDAKNQVNNYFQEYGYLDDENNRLRPRKPRIGDPVQTFRRSSPGIRIVGDDIHAHWDNSHDVFDEPTESLQDYPHPDVARSRERYDGDARWEQLSRTQQDVIYEYDILEYQEEITIECVGENGEILGAKNIKYVRESLEQGVWMLPIQAANLDVSPEYLETAPHIFELKDHKRGDGTVRTQRTKLVWVTKSEIHF